MCQALGRVLGIPGTSPCGDGSLGRGETDDKQAKQTNVCVCINYKLWEGLKWGRVEGESLWGGDLGRGEGAGM